MKKLALFLTLTLFAIPAFAGTAVKNYQTAGEIDIKYSAIQAACSLSTTTASACATVLRAANPRWWGAKCDYSANDDSIGIQSALNTGLDVGPVDGCYLTKKVNFTADGQTVFGSKNGGRYNTNFVGNQYLFVPNDIWYNRATSLNCGFDTNGYDNVGIKHLAIKGNYALVGTVAACNSVGIRSGRAAAFLNLDDVSFLNIGNGVGAAMNSALEFNGTSSSSVSLATGAANFTTQTGYSWVGGESIRARADSSNYMDGTVTSYNSGTGALVMNVTSVTGTPATYSSWTLSSNNTCTPVTTGSQAGLYSNVFQVRAKGVDMIGDCFGMMGNLSDFHLVEFFGASNIHNTLSTLPAFAGSWDISVGRVEYGGYGSGPTGQFTYYNDGAGIFFDSPAGMNASDIASDHQYGPAIVLGSNAKNIQLANLNLFGSYFNATAGITEQCHISARGVKGLTVTNLATQRNGVNTPYVFCFSGSNDYVSISGEGGGQGSGASTGQWGTSYFQFTTTPTNFSYNIPGVGILLGNLTGYTEVPVDVGNSSTAITLDLANGTFQKVTATGNATVTMPTLVSGKSFTLRYYTGAGSFTATFTGVDWGTKGAPTLTVTASRMDIFTFISDGGKWYGSYDQGHTP